MNYDEMSDFEINKAVAGYQGGYGGIAERGDNAVCVYDTEYGRDFYSVRGYCNDPTDAWPIIIKSKINIDFRESISAGPMCRVSGKSELYHVDKNPLRAAMIVFLKMKEGE